MQSCPVFKNTSGAVRKLGGVVHLRAGAYVFPGGNPSAYVLLGSGRGVAQDGRPALAADRTSRWIPSQPGKNPAPADGWDASARRCPRHPVGQPRGCGSGGIPLLKEVMALAPEQTSPFQPAALCSNSCKVFCCFPSLVDQ